MLPQEPPETHMFMGKDTIAFDLMRTFDHLPVSQRYEFVLVDYYCKWTEVMFSSSVNTYIVIKAFAK